MTATTTQYVKVHNRLTVDTLRAAAYTTDQGVQLVDLQVGILPHNSSVISRRMLTIPLYRLLNGRRIDNIRTARYSVLMNIISAWAEELWHVDFDLENVVFLGFIPRPTPSILSEEIAIGKGDIDALMN